MFGLCSAVALILPEEHCCCYDGVNSYLSVAARCYCCFVTQEQGERRAELMPRERRFTCGIRQPPGMSCSLSCCTMLSPDEQWNRAVFCHAILLQPLCPSETGCPVTHLARDDWIIHWIWSWMVIGGHNTSRNIRAPCMVCAGSQCHAITILVQCFWNPNTWTALLMSLEVGNSL